MIKCLVCTKIFRHLCVDLTVEELNMLAVEDRGCSWSSINCRQIGNQINDLKSFILSLQEDIKALKTENVGRKASSDEIEFEEVVMELNERNIQKKNIVIFDVSEHSQDEVAENRAEMDKTVVTNIFTTIDSDVQVDNIKPYRLGRFSNDRVHSIKIVCVMNYKLGTSLRKLRI